MAASVVPGIPYSETISTVGEPLTLQWNYTASLSPSSKLTIEFRTGSDSVQPLLETVYSGPANNSFTSYTWTPLEVACGSGREVGYPYGQRYFFRFETREEGKDPQLSWSTRFFLRNPQREMPSDPLKWPYVGEWLDEQGNPKEFEGGIPCENGGVSMPGGGGEEVPGSNSTETYDNTEAGGGVGTVVGAGGNPGSSPGTNGSTANDTAWESDGDDDGDLQPEPASPRSGSISPRATGHIVLTSTIATLLTTLTAALLP